MSHRLSEQLKTVLSLDTKANRAAARRFRKWLEQYDNQKIDTGMIDATIRQSMQLPSVGKRDNLYAICVPVGCGKTTMCEDYGLLDVDDCVTGGVKREFHRAIVEMMQNGRVYIEGTGGSAWVSELNDTLDRMTFAEPCVIMLHDVMTAHMIGARVLACVTTDKSTLAESMRGRPAAEVGAAMATVDIMNMVHKVAGRGFPVVHGKNVEEISMKVARILEVNNMPMPVDHGEMGSACDDFENGEGYYLTAWSESLAYGRSDFGDGWKEYAALAMLKPTMTRRAVRGDDWTEFAECLHVMEHDEVRVLIKSCQRLSTKRLRRVITWWKLMGQDMVSAKAVLSILCGLADADTAIVERMVKMAVGQKAFMGYYVNQEDANVYMALLECWVGTRDEARKAAVKSTREGGMSSDDVDNMKSCMLQLKHLNLRRLTGSRVWKSNKLQLVSLLKAHKLDMAKVSVSWVYWALRSKMPVSEIIAELDIAARVCRNKPERSKDEYVPITSAGVGGSALMQAATEWPSCVVAVCNFGEVERDIPQHVVRRCQLGSSAIYDKVDAMVAGIVGDGTVFSYGVRNKLVPSTLVTHYVICDTEDMEAEAVKKLEAGTWVPENNRLNSVKKKLRDGEVGTAEVVGDDPIPVRQAWHGTERELIDLWDLGNNASRLYLAI